MPYKPTGRRPGRPTREEAEERAKKPHPLASPSKLLPETQGIPELAPREERLAMLYAEGRLSLSECCRRVGLNPESHGLRDRVKHGDIGKIVVHRMHQLGISLDAPLLKIRDFYDAKKEVINPAMSSNAAHAAAMIQGQTVSPTLELRDNESQRWAVEQTLKLHGAYPKTNEEPSAKHDGPIVAIEFVSRQPAHDGDAEQRVTAVLDFGKRPGGRGDAE